LEELHDDETEFEFSKQGLPSNVRRIAVKSARGRLESLEQYSSVCSRKKRRMRQSGLRGLDSEDNVLLR
jgi:hypothetical protein